LEKRQLKRGTYPRNLYGNHALAEKDFMTGDHKRFDLIVE
jgi:hypothetical protein